MMFGVPSSLGMAALMLATSTSVHAYPDKAISMIVPFAAGSSTDVNAREFGQLMSRLLQQPVVVENRTGAEGTIGAKAVLSAHADGHTMLFTSSSLPVLDPLMKKSLPYDFTKDFAPLCTAGRTGFMLNITAASPMLTAADVIAAAKAAPGKLTFAYSSGSTRVAAELFQQSAGVKLTGVPYRSSVAGLTDVAGGQVDLSFIDPVSAGAFYQSGKLRPIMAAGPQRMKALPTVPSATEVGLSGYSVQPWYGLYVSSKVPAALLQEVRNAVSGALRAAEATSIFEKQNLNAFVVCGDEFSKFQADEIKLWRQVINKAGIEPE
jgi:tripartite-type tricarboxylate transporter receptor subunit TctC